MTEPKTPRTRPPRDMRVPSAWLSTGTKLVGLAVIMSIAIVKLTDIELNVWLLGLVAINVINLIEFSISPTTVRQLSYQRGMAEETRSDAIASAAYTLHKGAALVVALCSGLAILAYMSISAASQVLSPLIWAIPALLYFKLITAYYAAVLHAHDRIPYHRVTEAIANVIATLLTIAVLAVTTNVALLLCMQVIPQSIILPLIRRAARRHQQGERFGIAAVRTHGADIVTPTLNQLNASLLGFGALQIVAIYINATNSIAYANAFLLSLRIIQSIATFTNPIFYTYIPQLARLYKSDGPGPMRVIARQKQRHAVLAFVAATQIITLALVVVPLDRFGLEGKLPEPWMWVVLSVALLFHRIGAINLQTAALMGLVRFQSAEFAATLALLVQIALLALVWNLQNIPINLLLTYLVVYLPMTFRIRRQAESLSP